MSLRGQILLSFLGAASLIVGLFAVLLFLLVSSRFQERFARERMVLAEQLARTVDGDHHLGFRSPAATENPDFVRQLENMRHLLEMDEFITYIYSLNYDRAHDELLFGIDAFKLERDLLWIESADFAVQISARRNGLVLSHLNQPVEELLVPVGGQNLPVTIREEGEAFAVRIGQTRIATITRLDPLQVFIAHQQLSAAVSVEREFDIEGAQLPIRFTLGRAGQVAVPPGTPFVDTDIYTEKLKGIIRSGRPEYDRETQSTAYGEILAVYAPIHSQSSGEPTGLLVLEISTHDLDRLQADFLWRTVIVALFAIALIGLTSVALSRYLTRPIRKLAKGIQQISDGNLDSRVEIDRRDEFGQLGSAFNAMAGRLKLAYENLSNTNAGYRRFVPEEFLRYLGRERIWEVQLGDNVSREMTVLFSDIRSFTEISETMLPGENFDFVNRYLKSVSPKIRDHNGIIVKYLGDGMMALFPQTTDDAINAGIAKLREVDNLNRGSAAKPIRIGVGVHYGPMMVGIIGEEARMQGDAFSDTVNLAARLESLTRFYEVPMVVSGAAKEQTSMGEEHFRLLDRIIVKGRKHAVDVFEVIAASEQSQAELRAKTAGAYNEALELYANQNFEAARTLLEEVLAVNANDGVALLYLTRIEHLLASGVPDGWHAITRLDSK